MKKIYALILTLVVALSLAACSKDSVVGVYTTDSWNGKTGTLVLYKDGTCQYPSGANATWMLKENIVLITLEHSGTIQDGSINRITIYFDDSISNEEAKTLSTTIAKLDNVESIHLVEGSTRSYNITLKNAETDNKTLDALTKMEGVKIIQADSIAVISTSEHEAKIMEKGLVLHGHFFEKVSN